MITRDTVKDKIAEVDARLKELKKDKNANADIIADLEKKKANLLRLQVWCSNLKGGDANE